MVPLIVTFYTRKTSYEAEAADLCMAFNTFNVSVRAIAYDNAGDWMTNALQRSTLLERYAEEHPNNVIIMLDADVRPIKYPKLFMEWNGMFACEDRGPSVPRNRRFSAGVTLWGVKGRAMLAKWAALCRLDPERNKTVLREQAYLHDCVTEYDNIGEDYNCKPENIRASTVLTHSVASRKALREIGGQR